MTQRLLRQGATSGGRYFNCSRLMSTLKDVSLGRGKAVVLPTLGGSLPLYLLRDRLAVDSVTLSLANHDNNQHAEDENLRLGNLWEAIEIATAVMQMR